MCVSVVFSAFFLLFNSCSSSIHSEATTILISLTFFSNNICILSTGLFITRMEKFAPLEADILPLVALFLKAK